MTLKFERFEAYGSSFSAKISLRNNGQIGFSQGALRRMGIAGEGHYVVLFYDPEARVIGIRHTEDKDEAGAVPVHVRPASRDGKSTSVTAHVSGKSFLEYYEIPYKRSRQYVPEWSDEHEMYIVDLNKEYRAERRRNKEKQVTIQEESDDIAAQHEETEGAKGEREGNDEEP